MPLRPDDVIRKSFGTSLLRRGYDEKQVDAFLEEVVVELRRLYGRIDDLEAETARLAARSHADETSERVQREQHQVDLIRAERRDLVSQIAGVQARLDTSVREAEQAEARAVDAGSAAEDAEARRTATATALQETQNRLVQAQAEYDETVAARERAGIELRTLRVAAEERGGAALPDLQLRSGETPEDDLDVILTVARAVHDDYVEAGRRDADTLRLGAERDADAQRAEVRREVATLVNRATEQSTTLLAQAQAEHARVVGEAEELRAGILADLQARRELLERRIAELDRQQGEHRDRLRALVQEQLTALDDERWRAGLTAVSEV